jgi:hypothetical protein
MTPSFMTHKEAARNLCRLSFNCAKITRSAHMRARPSAVAPPRSDRREIGLPLRVDQQLPVQPAVDPVAPSRPARLFLLAEPFRGLEQPGERGGGNPLARVGGQHADGTVRAGVSPIAAVVCCLRG